jgi:hypothetical protein
MHKSILGCLYEQRPRARPEDLKTLLSYCPTEALHQTVITPRNCFIQSYLDRLRLILHSVQQHYSCFVATLHTRHVCTLNDATTRNQAKRLCGPASLSYLRSAPSTHRTFLGKAKVFIGWPSLSLRVYIPA